MSKKYYNLAKSNFPELKIKLNGDMMVIDDKGRTLKVDLRSQFYTFSGNGEDKNGGFDSIITLIKNLIYGKQ